MALRVLSTRPRWFARLSPASKVVLVFTALNVTLVLLFTLAVEPVGSPRSRTSMPILDPAQAALRVVLAVLVMFAVLRYVDLVRPTWRSMGISATVLTLATALLTLHYTPVLALAYLPIVYRVRLSLGHTILVSALSMAVLVAIEWALHGGSVLELGWASQLDAITLALASGVLGAYLLLTFELALREAHSRQQIIASHRELERLRDLELREASREERARIARELHDTLGHHLTAQRFDLQYLREELAPGRVVTGAHAESLGRAADRNADALRDLRGAVDLLRRDTGPANVRQALERLVAFWAPGVDVHLDVQTDVSDRLDDEGRLTLLRAAQEALTNAAKHAPHAPLTLRLRAGARHVEFEARNPGDETPHAEGFGVRGLRERAMALGGSAGLRTEEGAVCLWMTLPARSTS